MPIPLLPFVKNPGHAVRPARGLDRAYVMSLSNRYNCQGRRSRCDQASAGVTPQAGARSRPGSHPRPRCSLAVPGQSACRARRPRRR